MKWIKIKDQQPQDDKDYYVTNINVPMSPLKAYYSEEYDQFLCIESLLLTPVSVTHYMEMPEKPRTQDD